MRLVVTRGMALFLLVGGGLLLAAGALGIVDLRALKARIFGTVSNTVAAAGSGMSMQGSRAGSGAVAAASACRDNLKRIESAKRAVASKTGINVGSVSWDAVRKEMRGRKAVCPAGGSYSLNSLQHLPTCSVAANGTGDPADDHIIARY